MPRFMSALARKQVEESVDAQPRLFEGKYEGLAEIAEDAEEQTFGDLFWEFIADELMVEDEE
ncbi:MAG: hypothetical protein P8Z75_01675 [Gammaproteobacteria bacterium]|jgi:uncharacterized MAPEG superfamily protein